MSTAANRLLRACLFLSPLPALLLAGCFLDHDVKPPPPAGSVVASGAHDYGFRVDGRQRTFRLYVPPGYNGQQPLPLLIALHGGLGTGEIFEHQSHLDRVAARDHFLIAYPDGVGRGWNAGSCCGSPMEDHVDDVGFIDALEQRLVKDFAVDPTRIYGTGFSNGAMMLWRVSCQQPQLFAAIATVEGGLMMKHCEASLPMPTMIIGGLKDERIPWHGGVFRGTFRPSVASLVDGLRSRNGCSGKPAVNYDRNQVLCRDLDQCRSKAAIRWCRIANGGHQWAGGKAYFTFLLGPNNEKFDASAQVWQFLSRYRRAADGRISTVSADAAPASASGDQS
jgi:Poly(3-hydroxybutyrate) depolymerase